MVAQFRPLPAAPGGSLSHKPLIDRCSSFQRKLESRSRAACKWDCARFPVKPRMTATAWCPSPCGVSGAPRSRLRAKAGWSPRMRQCVASRRGKAIVASCWIVTCFWNQVAVAPVRRLDALRWANGWVRSAAPTSGSTRVSTLRSARLACRCVPSRTDSNLANLNGLTTAQQAFATATPTDICSGPPRSHRRGSKARLHLLFRELARRSLIV